MVYLLSFIFSQNQFKFISSLVCRRIVTEYEKTIAQMIGEYAVSAIHLNVFGSLCLYHSSTASFFYRYYSQQDWISHTNLWVMKHVYRFICHFILLKCAWIWGHFQVQALSYPSLLNFCSCHYFLNPLTCNAIFTLFLSFPNNFVFNPRYFCAVKYNLFFIPPFLSWHSAALTFYFSLSSASLFHTECLFLLMLFAYFISLLYCHRFSLM